MTMIITRFSQTIYSPKCNDDPLAERMNEKNHGIKLL